MEAEAWRPRCQAIRAILSRLVRHTRVRELPAACHRHTAGQDSEQSSMPSNAPPATTTQTTGEASRDPTVKKMNEDEKAKVDTKGK